MHYCNGNFLFRSVFLFIYSSIFFRQRILGEMENSENKIEFETRTVYNLDELIVSQPISDVILRNDDEER